MANLTKLLTIHALLALSALPLLAQETERMPDALSEGRWSFAFELPAGGGGAIGIWKLISDRTNLGLNLSFAVDRRTTDISSDGGGSSRALTHWDFAAAPALKRYLAARGPVAPYLYGDFSFLYSQTTFDPIDAKNWDVDLGAGAAVGADWFPLSRVSIGGYTGVMVRWRVSEQRHVDVGGRSYDFSLDTFTSRLFLHVYF